MFVNSTIGFVTANSTSNNIIYSFDSCEYVSKSIIYKDSQFCKLFAIDQNYGLFLYEKLTKPYFL